MLLERIKRPSIACHVHYSVQIDNFCHQGSRLDSIAAIDRLQSLQYYFFRGEILFAVAVHCTQSLSVTIYVRGALAKYLPPTTVVIRRWWVKGGCVINCGIRKLISSKTRRERVENFRGPDWRPAIALVPLKLLAFLPVTDLCAIIIIIVRQVRRYLYLCRTWGQTRAPATIATTRKRCIVSISSATKCAKDILIVI